MILDKTYTILQNDSFYIVAAMVIDADGVYSPIAKHEIRTSYDGARTDAEWWDEWWNGSGVSISSLVINDEQPKALFTKKANHTNKLSKQGVEVKGARVNVE